MAGVSISRCPILRSASATSLSVDQHWQGLRLIYGGGKQKVVEAFLGADFAAEGRHQRRYEKVLGIEERYLGPSAD